MMMMGYQITQRAQRAGMDAIKAQKRTFAAAMIGRAISPYVKAGKTAWAHKTPLMAAHAAAQQIIWDAYRAGEVEPTAVVLGVQQWQIVKPRGAHDR